MTRVVVEMLPGSPATDGRVAKAGKRARAFRAGVAKLLGLNQSASLSRRFMIASLAVLMGGGIFVGWWVGGQLERGIIDRSASITGLYVESFIQPHLETLEQSAWLNDTDIGQLDDLLTSTSFGERVVALKVWRPDGVIVYSPDRTLIGQRFPVDANLAAAVSGKVIADMSALSGVENVNERARGFDRLLEMYIPVRARGGDQVIAVAELYQLPTEIDQNVASAQLGSWLVVAAGVLVVYVLLYGIVRQGSDTIERQQLALRSQVSELSALLRQNEQLRRRARTAAERNTAITERHLRRVSADLHDGPGQMLGLAMLRLDRLRLAAGEGGGPGRDAEVDELRATLDGALRDMRAISAGLRLPELEALSPAEVVRRAVDDHARRTDLAVDLRLTDVPAEAPLSTKIALFRATQELLSNATRHGGGRDVSAELEGTGHELRLTVSDAGPGIDPTRVGAEGHLGLAGIREQSELLGGRFEVGNASTGGARVTVAWAMEGR